mgnify:CR=1 FL=1
MNLDGRGPKNDNEKIPAVVKRLLLLPLKPGQKSKVTFHPGEVHTLQTTGVIAPIDAA